MFIALGVNDVLVIPAFKMSSGLVAPHEDPLAWTTSAGIVVFEREAPAKRTRPPSGPTRRLARPGTCDAMDVYVPVA